ncbi:MAG: glycosyltransferase [Ferruginibacter sp.]
MKMNMVIGFYAHPEYYPPTLNALACLSSEFNKIYVVHRNYPSFNWEFPSNVELVSNGRPLATREMERMSAVKKVFFFLRFTTLLLRQIRNTAPDTVLLYDSIAVLAYRLGKPFFKKPRILWYHNHDVIEPGSVKKYSLGGWALKAEKWIFNKLDIFSLPALERKDHFPMSTLKGAFYFLPNYPSLKIYNQHEKHALDGQIKILYQGSISPMHGLEEIIGMLKEKIGGREVQLVLKGFINQEYLASLYELADKYFVKDRLIYIGPGGYSSVIENAAQCHIGIGIHKRTDLMNSTLGTASNKIYEYAASGMPVILYDNIHFKDYLENAPWAFFTDCSDDSLSLILHKVAHNYDFYSNEARRDFEEKLNFEHYFDAIIAVLQTGRK